MDSLKINSYNNNIMFKSIKNTKVIKAAALTGITGTGILLQQSINPVQTKKYSKKSKTPDWQKELVDRIMKMQKKLEEKEAAGESMDSDEIHDMLMSESVKAVKVPDLRSNEINEDMYDEFFNGNNTPIKMTDFKKEASIIKNKQLKTIAETICRKNQLNKGTMNFIRDIDAGLENITDSKILKPLKTELKRLAEINYDTKHCDKPVTGEWEFFSSLMRAAELVDVYNTMTGKYSRYKAVNDVSDDHVFYERTRPAAYIKYIRENYPDRTEPFIKALYQEGQKHHLITDFENVQKTEALELLSIKKEMLDYMYEKYYINNITDKQAQELCREINNTYGVKVILSNKTSNIEKALNVIKKELEAWTEASGGKARLPRILDLNTIDADYSHASAYADIRGNLHYCGANINSYKTIRHEIMHLNEPTMFAMLAANAEQAQLIRSIIAVKKIKTDGRTKEILDWDNCKYREEFLKAGIEPDDIEYAYTNMKEFLSVASEGDLSQYSPQFRDVLIKMGMPEFVFDLPVDSARTKANVEIVKNIIKRHPKTKYDKLVKYYEEERFQELSPRDKLLSAIFGKKFK